jgi:hypothetical protein
MSASWNRNRLTAKLGIDYPIVQGPLGGLSSHRLTAAVSNFGGLGSFGAHTLAPEAIKDAITQIRSLTSKPFAMNLWVSMEDEGARTSDESGFNRSLAPLAGHLAELGAPRPEYKPYSPTRFEDQARVLLDAKVPVFSFIFGIPAKDILEECRSKDIVTIGTATTPEEAAALEKAGVDAIIVVHFSGRPRIHSSGRWRWSPRSSIWSLCRSSQRAVSGMRGALLPSWLWARRASRWERYSWHARNPGPAACIAGVCWEKLLATPD